MGTVSPLFSEGPYNRHRTSAALKMFQEPPPAHSRVRLQGVGIFCASVHGDRSVLLGGIFKIGGAIMARQRDKGKATENSAREQSRKPHAILREGQGLSLLTWRSRGRVTKPMKHKTAHEHQQASDYRDSSARDMTDGFATPQGTAAQQSSISVA